MNAKYCGFWFYLSHWRLLNQHMNLPWRFALSMPTLYLYYLYQWLTSYCIELRWCPNILCIAMECFVSSHSCSKWHVGVMLTLLRESCLWTGWPSLCTEVCTEPMLTLCCLHIQHIVLLLAHNMLFSCVITGIVIAHVVLLVVLGVMRLSVLSLRMFFPDVPQAWCLRQHCPPSDHRVFVLFIYSI